MFSDENPKKDEFVVDCHLAPKKVCGFLKKYAATTRTAASKLVRPQKRDKSVFGNRNSSSNEATLFGPGARTGEQLSSHGLD